MGIHVHVHVGVSDGFISPALPVTAGYEWRPSLVLLPKAWQVFVLLSSDAERNSISGALYMYMHVNVHAHVHCIYMYACTCTCACTCI